MRLTPIREIAKRILAVVLIGALGFWLRFKAPLSPAWRDGSGGAAYLVFWIFFFSVLWPAKPARIAISVLSVTCILEFLQLWQPIWLQQIRATFIGRVLLGTTFDWTDFPPYFAGAIIGWALLRLLRKSQAGRVRTQ